MRNKLYFAFRRAGSARNAVYRVTEFDKHGILPNAMQELYMLGLRPKPKRGLRPLHPGRGSPRGRSVKFSDIYTLSSDSKYSSERKTFPKIFSV